ncbi:hypothetical protein FF1_045067 [Malus domestica]
MALPLRNYMKYWTRQASWFRRNLSVAFMVVIILGSPKSHGWGIYLHVLNTVLVRMERFPIISATFMIGRLIFDHPVNLNIHHPPSEKTVDRAAVADGKATKLVNLASSDWLSGKFVPNPNEATLTIIAVLAFVGPATSIPTRGHEGD